MKASEQNATNHGSTSISAVDVRIAAMLIESPTLTDQAIAEKVGLSRQSVNRRRNATAVKELIRATLAIPEREIRRLTAKAMARLEALLDDEDPKVKLAAANSLLRIGASVVGRWPLDI